MKTEEILAKKHTIEFWAIIGSNLAIVAMVIALFTWNRSESRADYRSLSEQTTVIIRSIDQEIKDFHGRLCAIEERNKGYK